MKSLKSLVALGQIAVGFCEKTSISMPLILGALVGGAMFGDNLSIISIYIYLMQIHTSKKIHGILKNGRKYLNKFEKNGE